MDRGEAPKAKRWAWLPEAMPGVTKMMAEKREQFGAAWVAECWAHGVTKGEPGWFFAREGALAVGTPWDEPDMEAFGARALRPGQALVILRQPAEGQHGPA
jgi:hypothetical protein